MHPGCSCAAWHAAGTPAYRHSPLPSMRCQRHAHCWRRLRCGRKGRRGSGCLWCQEPLRAEKDRLPSSGASCQPLAHSPAVCGCVPCILPIHLLLPSCALRILADCRAVAQPTGVRRLIAVAAAAAAAVLQACIPVAVANTVLSAPALVAKGQAVALRSMGKHIRQDACGCVGSTCRV